MITVLLMLAAAAGPNKAHGPTTTSDPATWFSPEDYPPSALRAHEEGATRFTLQISASGAVTGCEIAESSGYQDLDTQTCASAMKNAHFTPATEAGGRPIASRYVQRTRWVLPKNDDDAGEIPFMGMWGNPMNMVSAEAKIGVDATGKVLSCRISRAANTTVDPCLSFPVGKVIVAPTIVAGQPVAATVTAVTMLSVKPQK